MKESYFLVPQFLRKQTISRAPLVLTGLFISYGEYANNANSEVIYKIWHKEVNLKHVVWKTYVIYFLSSSIAEDLFRNLILCLMCKKNGINPL